MYAQSVGIGTGTPDPSAILDLTSSNKGFLPPRLSTLQRDSIQNPQGSLLIFNTTTNTYQYFSKAGNKWFNFNASAGITDSGQSSSELYGEGHIMMFYTPTTAYVYYLTYSNTSSYTQKLLPLNLEGTFAGTAVAKGMVMIYTTSYAYYYFVTPATSGNHEWLKEPLTGSNPKAFAIPDKIVIYTSSSAKIFFIDPARLASVVVASQAVNGDVTNVAATDETMVAVATTQNIYAYSTLQRQWVTIPVSGDPMKVVSGLKFPIN